MSTCGYSAPPQQERRRQRGQECSIAVRAAGIPSCSRLAGSPWKRCPRFAIPTNRSPRSTRPSRVRWPALTGAVWFPVISDGFSSNLGAGAHDESAIAAAAATSGAMRVLVHGTPEKIPSGLWCYRVDRQRSLLGGAVNDVGRVVSWLQGTLQLSPDEDPNVILAAAPSPITPLVLPYFSGERSTGWAANARAVFAGVSTATTGAMLYRAAMEGVAISYARIADQLQTVAGRPQRILASGRVASDLPALLQLLSDVLEAPVTPVTIKRSTLRGTAIAALEVLAPGVVRAPSATGDTRQPVAHRADYYRARKQAYQTLYEAAISTVRNERGA